MFDNILKLNGLSIDELEELSFKSNLGKSLRNKLKSFDRGQILDELYHK